MVKAQPPMRFGLEIVTSNIDGMANQLLELIGDLVSRIDP